MRFLLVLQALWLLTGCSVAALVQEQSLEARMTAMEVRVHALEAAK